MILFLIWLRWKKFTKNETQIWVATSQEWAKQNWHKANNTHSKMAIKAKFYSWAEAVNGD